MLGHGSVIAGRYRIVAEIGAGALGVVYRAEADGAEIALKIIDEPDDGRAGALLEAVRRAAVVTHPRVARTLDCGREGQLVWVAMERVQGRSLADQLEDGPLSVAETVHVIAAICGALDAAHASGILHSDLKPGNVIVGPEGVKVTDFGLAGARGQATGKYASPESSHGYPVDERSDLYSLGVLACELLTGSHHDDSEDAPLLLPDEVPAAVRAVLIRLLHKDRSARFRNAAAVGAALEDALGRGQRAGVARPKGWRVVGVAVIAAAAIAALVLVRDRSETVATAALAPRAVVVNRVQVKPEVLAAYEREVRARVPDGSYWYDGARGAWGLEGGPALGVTRPHVDFGGAPPSVIGSTDALPERPLGRKP